jgi:hypothetical protein
MFLGSVSGGLIALGLVATATRLGTAFYAFGLVLLPLLGFVGALSFERTLQCGIEAIDRQHGRRDHRSFGRFERRAAPREWRLRARNLGDPAMSLDDGHRLTG